MDLYTDTAKICFIAGLSFGLGLYVSYKIADFIEAVIDRIRNPNASR